jgi:hypothetical protein
MNKEHLETLKYLVSFHVDATNKGNFFLIGPGIMTFSFELNVESETLFPVLAKLY